MMALLGLGEPGANMPVVAMPAVPERSVAVQPEATVPGHELALVVLGLLALALGRALLVLAGGRHRLQLAPPWQHALVPVLALAGLGVASYLAAVELKHTAAICGPVGDCNTVQQSAYARLFGLIPMGFLGVGGYLALLALWLTGRRLAVTRGRSLQLSMLALVLGGALFSFYLTVLELFVIKAVCLWCLSSAVIMAALLWLIGTPGRQVLRGSGTQKAARG